jgi:O-antigen ligase
MTYSTLLAFTVNILLIRFFYEKNLKYKLFYILFFLTATTNLFINGGRTGQIIFILLIFITIFTSLKHKIRAFTLSALILTTTFVLAYNFSPNFHNRSTQLYNDFHNVLVHHNYKGSGGTRIALSIMGIKTFLNNPLLGTGIAYNMNKINSYAKKNNFKQNFNHYADYHSAFITISVQLGTIGLFISLLIIFALFSFQIKEKEYKILSLLFATSFILFSFTHNTLHTMNPMVFFALFAGLFNSISNEKKLKK